jgi:hypothetical protein
LSAGLPAEDWVDSRHPNEEGSVHGDDEGAKNDDTTEDAAPGAAVDDQGLGQHDDKDVTDVETKQGHPATPS